MKVALCVPYHRQVEGLFAHALSALLCHTLGRAEQGSIEFNGVFAHSSVAADARNRAAEKAIKWMADWLLWLDSDQTFPPDTLFRLLAHGVDAVGCNVARRDGSGPIIPVDEGLKEVERIGMGVFLVSRRALDAIAAKAMKDGHSSPWPLFDTVHEDYFFMDRLRAAGIPIHVDHDLSREIGHIGSYVYKL
jgi:hypothetical protein